MVRQIKRRESNRNSQILVGVDMERTIVIAITLYAVYCFTILIKSLGSVI